MVGLILEHRNGRSLGTVSVYLVVSIALLSGLSSLLIGCPVSQMYTLKHSHFIFGCVILYRRFFGYTNSDLDATSLANEEALIHDS